MSARIAYPMLYERVMAGRNAEQRLEVDAILGDPGAVAEIERREQDVLESSGAVEFG